MNIEMHFIRHVVALHEFGHFGLAAKSLNLSQPALSRSISTLENKLGAQLFERGAKPLRATEFGRFFLERALPLLASADAFAKQVSEAESTTYPNLRIGSGPYPAETIVASTIQRFTRKHDKVRVLLMIRGADELVSLLNSGDGLDFFIAEISLLGTHRNLSIKPLGQPPVALLARAGHPLLSTRFDLESIFRYPLLVSHPIPPRLMNPILSIWKNIPEPERHPIPAVECASVSIAKRLMLESDMVGAMPLSSAVTELECGDLVPLNAEPWMHLNYGIVYLKEKPPNVHATAFLHLLTQLQAKLARQEERLHQRYMSG